MVHLLRLDTCTLAEKFSSQPRLPLLLPPSRPPPNEPTYQFGLAHAGNGENDNQTQCICFFLLVFYPMYPPGLCCSRDASRERYGFLLLIFAKYRRIKPKEIFKIFKFFDPTEQSFRTRHPRAPTPRSAQTAQPPLARPPLER